MIRRNLFPNRRFIAVVAVVAAAIVPGCTKGGEPAPANPAAAQPSNAGAAHQAKPVQKQVSSALALPAAQVNRLDFSNKKDPFKPFASVKAALASAERVGKRGGGDDLPIHSFEVSQFRLIGIVTGDNQGKALVVDPNGKGYVLKVGMTIGRNEGVVHSITNSGVDVVEQFRDDNGRLRKETVTITLPRKQ